MLVQEAMQTQLVTIDAHATLPDAVVRMQTLGARRLPVLHEGRLAGLVTDGEVNRALPRLSEQRSPWDFAYHAGRVRVREIMRREVLTAAPEEPLSRALHTLLERRVGGLPVVDAEGRLVGMLTFTSVLKAAARQPRPQWGAVRQHMTRETVTVAPELPLPDAAAQLAVTRLRVMPVVDGQRLLGVLHERDIRALVERGEAAHGPTVLAARFFLQGQRARDLMRPPGAEVLASAPLVDAINAMLAADVHGLPVVSDGHTLLGVITISDVLGALLAAEGQPDAAQEA